MNRIICDTNIWYYLGSKQISPPSNGQLFATWSNVIELAYVHPENRKYFNYTDWKNAASAILKYSNGIIDLDPFEYSANKLFPGVVDFKKRDLLRIIQIISEQTKPLDEETYLSNIEHFNSFKKIKDDFVIKLKEYKVKARKELITNQKTKDIFKSSQEKYHIYRAIDVISDIDSYLKLEHNKAVYFENEDDIKQSLAKVAEEFEFYILTKQRFLRNLVLQGAKHASMTIEPNDFIDLTNLLYIGKEDFYWTMENRWVNMINEANLANQLIKTT